MMISITKRNKPCCRSKFWLGIFLIINLSRCVALHARILSSSGSIVSMDRKFCNSICFSFFSLILLIVKSKKSLAKSSLQSSSPIVKDSISVPNLLPVYMAFQSKGYGMLSTITSLYTTVGMLPNGSFLGTALRTSLFFKVTISGIRHMTSNGRQ